MTRTRTISRRTALGVLLAAGGALVGCSRDDPPVGQEQIRSREARRATSGRTVRYRIEASLSTIDLGAGTAVATWAYGGVVPGAVLRATAGDRLRVSVHNGLPEATSVHWHGPAVRNDVDGVPGVTTPEIGAGTSREFAFIVPTPGTHWLHPHHGVQLDKGLYAPLIVDDPHERGDYDDEVLVVLDDWTDGLGPAPQDILAQLRAGGGGRAGHGMGSMPGMGGVRSAWAAGDWQHAAHLVNGRLATDPAVAQLPPRARVRLRVINAAADTAYRVAVAGQLMTVTHTDGFPVDPVQADVVRLGMGERIDAIVTLTDTVTALVAAPEGKQGLGRMLLRTGVTGAAPAPDARPVELQRRPVLGSTLRAAPAARLARRDPNRVLDVVLSGGMGDYVWTINGQAWPDTQPLRTTQGERLRLRVANRSMMAHPLHLHGHTAQVVRGDGDGSRKDTVLVPPMGTVQLDVDADNPGTWMVHCHNAYHAEAGMMTRLQYVR